MIPNDWTELESSQIQRVKFIQNERDLNGELLVEFRTGMVYSYRGVPSSRAENLVHSSSPGDYFKWNIRGSFDANKV